MKIALRYRTRTYPSVLVYETIYTLRVQVSYWFSTGPSSVRPILCGSRFAWRECFAAACKSFQLLLLQSLADYLSSSTNSRFVKQPPLQTCSPIRQPPLMEYPTHLLRNHVLPGMTLRVLHTNLLVPVRALHITTTERYI